MAGKTRHHKQPTAKKPPPPAAPDKTPGKPQPFEYFPTEKAMPLLAAARRPYKLPDRDWRPEIPHLLALFFLIWLFYGLTTPHFIALEDDGLFIGNMAFFGVGHPPGYPVHSFLGGIFYRLIPFGSAAFRGHLFSGFAAALACVAVYAFVLSLLRGRIFAYLAAFAYAASEVFWSQAIIAEVYTLNALFFFVVLFLCLRYASASSDKTVNTSVRPLCLIAFVYGVGIANHYPILGLGTIGLFPLVFSRWGAILKPSHLLPAIACLSLGAVPPYLWMVWRSHSSTLSNFYGPIESWEDFLFYFSRSGYSGIDAQAGVGWSDKLDFAAQLGNDMLWQFTPVGFLFVAVGFAVMWRSHLRWLALSLTLSWFCSSVLLVFLLDFRATFFWLSAFRVYHLLAYGIMAIWLAVGVAWLVDRWRNRRLEFRQGIGVGVAVIIVVASVTAHWRQNNRSDYRWAHDLAMAKLNSVEENAVLFLFDDLDLPAGFLHYNEGVRPDLTVYNDQGLVYSNRLYSPLIAERSPPNNPRARSKERILRDFVDDNDRPIYYHPQRRSLYEHPPHGSEATGFFRRIRRDQPGEGVALSEELIDWMRSNVGTGETISDPWARRIYHSTMTHIIDIALRARADGFVINAEWEEIIRRAREESTETRLLTNSTYLREESLSREQMEAELQWLQTHDLDDEPYVDEFTQSSFFALQAELLAKLRGDDHPDILPSLLQGIERDSTPNNASLFPLLFHYYEKRQACPFMELIKRFYPTPAAVPPQMVPYVQQVQPFCPNS